MAFQRLRASKARAIRTRELESWISF